MRNTRNAALVIAVALAITAPNSAFASKQPGADWKDQVVRAIRDNDPLSRFVKYVKHLISKLDEPQGPPPLPDGPGN
jgi:hypothetical protein